MIVFGQIRKEHIGFDGQVDRGQRVVEIGFDGDDRCLVGQHLPITVGDRLADVGGNPVFVGADQKDDGYLALGE